MHSYCYNSIKTLAINPPLLPWSKAFKVPLVGVGDIRIEPPETHERAEFVPHCVLIGFRDDGITFQGLEELGLVVIFPFGHDRFNVGTGIFRIKVGQKSGGAVTPSSDLCRGAKRQHHQIRRLGTGRVAAVVLGVAPEGGFRGARDELQRAVDGVKQFLNHALGNGVSSS